MNLAMTVLSLTGGLAFAGRGLWTWHRGGPLMVKSTGRVWASTGHAAAFWLLIGSGMTAAGLLRLGASAGLIGADAGFWLGPLPLAPCAAAVIGFRPRHPAQPR